MPDELETLPVNVKGSKYAPGTHWTQRPENKERVRELARRRGNKGQRGPKLTLTQQDRLVARAAKIGWRQAAQEFGVSSALAYRIKLQRKAPETVRQTDTTEVTPTHGNGTDGPSDTQVAYAFGRIEGWLDTFAQSRGLSRTALADEVGTLLRRSARR
jgi:hypothetical protein